VRKIALAAAVVAVGLAAPAEAGKKPVARARIQVVAQEFDFALSRRTIKAGPATIQLANFGEDAHDLRLKRIGGSKTLSLAEVQPGASADLRAKLAAGRYVLWCSISDHRARGMEARLVVKKRR
jgi:plastocyanin